MALRVGVIGVGNIGQAACRGLLAGGHHVKAFDLSPVALGDAAPAWVDSPVAAAADVDVLVTALPASAHVAAVMEGDGVLDALGSTAWVDHTTADPAEVRRMAGVATDAGVPYLEAPLTGGLQLLQQGRMTVYGGGDRSLFDAMLPLLQCYTLRQLYLGQAGAASTVKVVTNMLCAAHTAVTAEALTLLKSHDIDLDAAFDCVRLSAGNSYVFETEAPLMFNQTYDPGFTVGLHLKDLAIGAGLAEETGVPLEVLTLAHQVYRRGAARYGSDAGSTVPGKLLQDDTGHSHAVPGWQDWQYDIDHVEGGSMGVVHHRNGRNGTKQ